MRRTTLSAALVAACAGLAGILPVLGASAQPTAAPTSSAPVTGIDSGLALHVPKQMDAPSWGRRTYVELGLRLSTGSAPFELWSSRASYDEPIITEWRNGTDTVELPAGTMRSFRGLPGFLTVDIKNRAGETVLLRRPAICVNGQGERIRPDGAARSTYPWGCPWHPFTVGSVMGIPDGWAVHVPVFNRGQKLAKGRYTVDVSIAPRYRAMFGIPDEDAAGRMVLRVVDGDEYHGHYRQAHRAVSQEGLTRPTGPATQRPSGPVPNLRSLPASDIQVSENGNFLQFSATVWNAGDSPLVVDGFRRDGEDLMDAYQYFYDADGEQTGYSQVGVMEWDARDSHHHWHFRDFARYRLVNTDLTHVARSRKEAFCLANTDAVDYTIPNANWRPYGTDLATACGDYSSLAVREVLDVGSGDTYHQYRAGQSFNLKKVPNGVYYIAVEGNPHGQLVESDTTDNTALREIRIGGRDGRRTVKVSPVGIIDDTK